MSCNSKPVSRSPTRSNNASGDVPHRRLRDGAGYQGTEQGLPRSAACADRWPQLNNVDPASHDRLSQYSAYGYLEQWGASRIATKTYAAFKEHVDDRMSQVCSNAKAADITIYTVAFNVSDSATLDLLTACASQPPYAYTAETADELVAAFKQIASSLSHLRLAK